MTGYQADCADHGPDCPASRIVTEGMGSPEYAASYEASQEHDRANPWVGCPDLPQEEEQTVYCCYDDGFLHDLDDVRCTACDCPCGMVEREDPNDPGMPDNWLDDGGWA